MRNSLVYNLVRPKTTTLPFDLNDVWSMGPGLENLPSIGYHSIVNFIICSRSKEHGFVQKFRGRINYKEKKRKM
jgi:hypothetical protein